MAVSDRLQRELDRLVAVVDRGVSVDDVTGRILAFSARDGAADAARVSAILTRRVSPEVLAWEHSHGIEDARKALRIEANAELGIGPRLCVPLRHEDTLVGFLWVLETASLLDDDAVAVLQESATIITAALRNLMRMPAARPAVRDLVHARSSRRESACEEFIGAHPALLTGKVQFWAVAASQNRQGLLPLPQPVYLALEARLNSGGQESSGVLGGYVTSRHAIALLWAPSNPTAASTRWRSLLDGALPAVDEVALTSGVSEPTSFTPEMLLAAQQQAVAAAEAAAVDPAMPAELAWADAGVYRQLVPIASRQPPQPHPALQRLSSQDRGGTLRHTLETYLDLGGDAGATTKVLHLHRTSLYYRLDRIGQLTGLDLREGLIRLDLHLALKLDRLASR